MCLTEVAVALADGTLESGVYRVGTELDRSNISVLFLPPLDKFRDWERCCWFRLTSATTSVIIQGSKAQIQLSARPKSVCQEQYKHVH